MKRRKFLNGATAIAGVASVPHQVLSEIAIGGATLTTVSDGHLRLPADFTFGDLPPQDVAPLLEKYQLQTDVLTPDCNLALYRDDTNVVLFDVGSGADFMPSAGQITDSLDAIGLAPEDITHVVFTHAHPDHIWGLLDDFDDPLFYEAQYFMGRAEWDYWWNPNTVEAIGEARAAFAVGAKRRMERIEDQVTLFDDGEEILPNIAAVATYGHTPGHMSFDAGGGSDSALIVGDAIGNHHLAFAHPDWPSGADQDAQAAIGARQRLFDRIMTDQKRIVGFHLPDGGMGHVDRDGDGYRFIAEAS